MFDTIKEKAQLWIDEQKRSLAGENGPRIQLGIELLLGAAGAIVLGALLYLTGSLFALPVLQIIAIVMTILGWAAGALSAVVGPFKRSDSDDDGYDGTGEEHR